MLENETKFSFVLRFSFYTERQPASGGNFDTLQVIEDVKRAITRYPIELVNHVTKPVYDDDKMKIARHKIYLDFRINIESAQIDNFKDRRGTFLTSFGQKDPEQYFMKRYITILNGILEEIPGIDYVPASCNPYEVIRCEGRVDRISK